MSAVNEVCRLLKEECRLGGLDMLAVSRGVVDVLDSVSGKVWRLREGEGGSVVVYLGTVDPLTLDESYHEVGCGIGDRAGATAVAIEIVTARMFQ